MESLRLRGDPAAVNVGKMTLDHQKVEVLDNLKNYSVERSRKMKMGTLKQTFNSIKAKIMVLVLLAVLVLVVSGVFALQSAGQIQEQHLFGALEDTAIANAEVVERELQMEVRSLFAISQSPILQEEDIHVSLTFLDNLLDEKKRMGSHVITMGLIDLVSEQK